MFADLAHVENKLSEEQQIIAILRSLPNSRNIAKQILDKNKSIKTVKELNQMLEVEHERLKVETAARELFAWPKLESNLGNGRKWKPSGGHNLQNQHPWKRTTNPPNPNPNPPNHQPIQGENQNRNVSPPEQASPT